MMGRGDGDGDGDEEEDEERRRRKNAQAVSSPFGEVWQIDHVIRLLGELTPSLGELREAYGGLPHSFSSSGSLG